MTLLTGLPGQSSPRPCSLTLAFLSFIAGLKYGSARRIVCFALLVQDTTKL